MVTTAFVNLWGQRIGAVAWNVEAQIGSFEYEPSFPGNRLTIAPIKMPSKSQIYAFPELRGSDTFRGLPGLLADVMPDRYGKELINIWLAQQGRPEDSLNPVELLCFIGKRGMGALEFEPVLQQRDPKSYAIELSSLIETTKTLLDRKEEVLLHTDNEMRDVMLDVLKMGTSAGGARPKAIIAYNESTGEIRSGQTTAVDGFEHWLIKFDGVSDAQFGSTFGYGRVEMAYYQMATDLGISMMESRLIEEGERGHFMTKRFDRTKNNEKIHSQTFCALQHYDFVNISSYSYEQLYQTMRLLRLTYTEAEELFRRLVFNVIARNCDDHTKNFGFLMNKEGQWRLSPAYDLCHAYRPGSAWVNQHNLSVNGKRQGITREDLLAIAAQNSIRRPDMVIDDCLKVVGRWSQYARQYQVEEKLAKAIEATLIKGM